VEGHPPSEEIDRLYQRELLADAIHSCIVGLIESNQEIRVCLRWERIENRAKRSGSQLACAPPAFTCCVNLVVEARTLPC
jgi:hypothetical protein